MEIFFDYRWWLGIFSEYNSHCFDIKAILIYKYNDGRCYFSSFNEASNMLWPPQQAIAGFGLMTILDWMRLLITSSLQFKYLSIVLWKIKVAQSFSYLPSDIKRCQTLLDVSP